MSCFCCFSKNSVTEINITVQAVGSSVSAAQPNPRSTSSEHRESQAAPLHLRIESAARNPERAPQMRTRNVQIAPAERVQTDLTAWVQKGRKEKPSLTLQASKYSPTIASTPRSEKGIDADAIDLREACQSPRKPEEIPTKKPKRSPVWRHTAELAIPAMEPLPGTTVIVAPLREKDSGSDKDALGLIIAPVLLSPDKEVEARKPRSKVAPSTPKIQAASPLSVFNIEVEVPSLEVGLSSQPPQAPKASRKLKVVNSRSLSDHIEQQEREHKQKEEDRIKTTDDGVPFQAGSLPTGGSSTLLSVLLETPKPRIEEA